MKRMTRRRRHRYTRLGSVDPTAAFNISEDLNGLNMRRVDEAGGHPRPSGIAKFYVEGAVDKKAAEQPLLWEAEGEAAARERQVEAAELEQAATVAKAVVAAQNDVEAAARKRYDFTADTLGGYTRRAPGEKGPYYARWLMILGGDVAGIAGAAILLGETVTLAVLQAVASGTAAITSGLIAQDVKDSRLARRRQKPAKELTPDEQRFAHLFKGGDSGEAIVKWAVGGGLLIGVLIAGSIFALRLTTEGSTAGWAFALLGAAVALASWANVYHYTDEVADLIDARLADWQRELKRLQKFAKEKTVARHDAARAEATSIKAEAAGRGRGAEKSVEAIGHQLLSRYPEVAGHGWADDQSRERTRDEEFETHEPRRPIQLPGVDLAAPYQPPQEVAAGADGSNGDHGAEE